MTYNFDPDRWFDIEQTALDARRARGELTEDEYQQALLRLTERYEKLLERLDFRCDYR